MFKQIPMQGKSIKIKVCGMRDGDNIHALEKAAPDMMGFICWEGSKRCIKEKPSYLPVCKKVGVFVEPTLELVRYWSDQLHLDYIQLHGRESEKLCEQIKQVTGLKLFKAISIRSKEDIEETLKYQSVADLFVFDTKCVSVGGSGQQFDWNILQDYEGERPFLLSGGIGPEDSERILSWYHPQCVGIDINSRFELSPAVKDTKAISSFIRKIRNHE